MNYRDRIVRDLQICAGEPVIKGTLVTVRLGTHHGILVVRVREPCRAARFAAADGPRPLTRI